LIELKVANIVKHPKNLLIQNVGCWSLAIVC